MSQLGIFFLNFFFLDSQHADLAPRADLHRACTWFFRAKARLEPDKSWKDVLDSRKTRQEECLGVASVITFACSHISRSDFEMTLIEGYVHGDANIRLGSLKRWLPMNHRELPELLEIEFEAILPGRKQHDQRNKQHPIIRNFLDETVREWSVDRKRSISADAKELTRSEHCC